MFKLQETEMMDPELDYTLMRVCKQMIKVMVVCLFKRVRLGYKSSVSFELPVKACYNTAVLFQKYYCFFAK